MAAVLFASGGGVAGGLLVVLREGHAVSTKVQPLRRAGRLLQQRRQRRYAALATWPVPGMIKAQL